MAQAGAGGQVADAQVCAIPNELVVTPDDAEDGGLPPGCENVPRKIIANNCIGGHCHDNAGPPSGGLNLMSPCVTERLVNVQSRCQGLLLIDTANPEKSFLLDKLNNANPTCGYSMPDMGRLSDPDLACMNAWIHAVIRAANGG